MGLDSFLLLAEIENSTMLILRSLATFLKLSFVSKAMKFTNKIYDEMFCFPRIVSDNVKRIAK